MKWFKTHKKTYPQFFESYLDALKLQPKELLHTRFVVFDTETTGLNPNTDRILSIGAIAITDFHIDVSDQFECYLNQRLFNAETVEIHGLLKAGSLEKIEEDDAIIQFLAYINNAVLVAHHASFDISMINEVLKRMGLPKLKNKVIDTGQLYHKTKYIKDNKHHSLDDLCQLFNITMHDRHTASGDAFLTALVFLKLSELLKQKKKRLQLSDYFSWI